ncbi:unnamed protein product [Closterium sp. NIES-64]|nr:unnamed protein product [Closterium sp. NIES-64]
MAEAPPRSLFPSDQGGRRARGGRWNRLRTRPVGGAHRVQRVKGQLEARSERVLEEERLAGARGAREEAQRQVEEARGEAAVARREAERARRYHEEEVAVLLGAHRDKEALWQRKVAAGSKAAAGGKAATGASMARVAPQGLPASAGVAPQGLPASRASCTPEQLVEKAPLTHPLSLCLVSPLPLHMCFTVTRCLLRPLPVCAHPLVSMCTLARVCAARQEVELEHELRHLRHRLADARNGRAGGRQQCHGPAARAAGGGAAGGGGAGEGSGGGDAVCGWRAGAAAGQADAAAQREELAAALIDRLHAENKALRGALHAAHAGGRGSMVASRGRVELECSRLQAAQGEGGDVGEGRSVQQVPGGVARRDMVESRRSQAPHPDDTGRGGGGGGVGGAEEARRGCDDRGGAGGAHGGQAAAGRVERAKEAAALYYAGIAGEEGEQEQRERQLEEVLAENARLEEQLRALQAQVAGAQRAVAWQGRLRQRVLQLRVCLELTSKVVDVKDRALELAVHRARSAEARCAHLDRHLLPSVSTAAPAALCECGSPQAAKGADGCEGIVDAGLQRRCAVAATGTVGEDAPGCSTEARQVRRQGIGRVAPRRRAGWMAQRRRACQCRRRVVSSAWWRRCPLAAQAGPACVAGAGRTCKAAVRRARGRGVASAVMGRKGKDKRGEVREMLAAVESEADEARVLIERSERVVARMATLERRGKVLERKIESSASN